MGPEVWSVISVGIVILIAIAAANRALRRGLNESLAEHRRDMSEMRRELGGRIDGLGERITAVQLDVGERSDAVQLAMTERIDAVQLAMTERIDAVQLAMTERIDGVQLAMIERINASRTEMNERFGELGERLGRVEGLLEGLGFAPRKRAGKGGDDGERAAALPQS